MALNFMKVRTGVRLMPNAAPASPENGDIWYDSGNNTFSFYQNGATITINTTAATSAATASTLMQRDSNANVQVNNIVENVATTATAAGTTTLTVASAPLQQFTGSTTQTVVLPNATTLANGTQFFILNRSTGAVTVNFNGGSLAATVAANTQVAFTVISNGTSAGTWDIWSTSTGFSGRAGSQTISNASTSQAVTFSSTLGTTNYAISVNMRNVTDANPQFQPVVITARSATGFTATWNAPTDSANYVLEYTAIPNA